MHSEHENMLTLSSTDPRYRHRHQWNDPDSLVVGMGRMTLEQERLHFSMWVMMASPLIAGNRLDGMSQQTVTILTHSGLIKINQDPMGIY